MTPFVHPSAENLLDRRRSLRRQRRLQTLRTLWQILAVASMASGTLWLMAHPFWLLQSHEQVIIEGNQLLSDETLREFLPIHYPQPLLRIQPEQIIHSLLQQSPITQATVTRQLFPPRLSIHVQERHPVALTVANRPHQAGALLHPQSAASHLHAQQGLLDSQGHWLSLQSLADVNPGFKLPTLTVRGFQSHYQTQWPSLYQALQESGLQVEVIDWQDPGNLILHTQLGTTHLGPYNARLIQQQLSTLQQLRPLAAAAQAPAVEYVDLRNPELPTVKIQRLPEAE